MLRAARIFRIISALFSSSARQTPHGAVGGSGDPRQYRTLSYVSYIDFCVAF